MTAYKSSGRLSWCISGLGLLIALMWAMPLVANPASGADLSKLTTSAERALPTWPPQGRDDVRGQQGHMGDGFDPDLTSIIVSERPVLLPPDQREGGIEVQAESVR